MRHKRIKTTLAKAKETRGFVEKIITRAKKGDLHSHKLIMDYIKDKEVVKELFADIVPKIGDRAGGYTRVIKLGNRFGDAASMAIIELVDYNDIITARDEARKEEKESKIKAKKEKEAQQPVEEANVISESKEK